MRRLLPALLAIPLTLSLAAASTGCADATEPPSVDDDSSSAQTAGRSVAEATDPRLALLSRVEEVLPLRFEESVFGRLVLLSRERPSGAKQLALALDTGELWLLDNDIVRLTSLRVTPTGGIVVGATKPAAPGGEAPISLELSWTRSRFLGSFIPGVLTVKLGGSSRQHEARTDESETILQDIESAAATTESSGRALLLGVKDQASDAQRLVLLLRPSGAPRARVFDLGINNVAGIDELASPSPGTLRVGVRRAMPANARASFVVGIAGNADAGPVARVTVSSAPAR